MNPHKRQINVTVAGQDFLVEIQDLNSDPIIATIGDNIYEVSMKDTSTSELVTEEAAEPTSVRKPPPTVKLVKAPASAPHVMVVDSIVAPLPGDIIDIFVKPGDSISAGQELCSLEAMKMKNTIRSSRDGVIASVPVTRGQTVSYGEALVTFE